MGDHFDRRVVAEIKARTRLADLVGELVALKAQGRGELVGLCPFHNEKTPSFSVVESKGFYHCFGCGAHGDVITWVINTTSARNFAEAVEYLARRCGVLLGACTVETRPIPMPSSEQEARRREGRRRDALALFLNARPLAAGDPVARYLLGRGIDLGQLASRDAGRLPAALRYAPNCWNGESRRAWPAMVAAVTDAAGRHIATHRTFLEEQRDGSVRKAPLTNPKMSLGSYAGGCIRLWRGASGRRWAAAPAGEELLAGEGIEDTLTGVLWLPERRAFAAVALGNLRNIALPAGAAGLIWLQQNDPAGSGAAQALARAAAHFRAQGKTVRLLRAPVFVKDANEFQQRLAGVA